MKNLAVTQLMEAMRMKMNEISKMAITEMPVKYLELEEVCLLKKNVNNTFKNNVKHRHILSLSYYFQD